VDIEIGSYQLREPIGEGASATVYRAVAPDGTEVALKRLLDVDSAALEREVAALSRVQHPNLVKLLDHGVDASRGAFVVTELVRGKTLREHGRGRRLPPGLALALVDPLLCAVGALHAAGIVHRDLKPENVVVADDGRVVLIDLGVSRATAGTATTSEGAVTGTLPYVSPERIDGVRASPASDVWALATILFELIAGERPFARPRTSDELAAIAATEAPSLGHRDRRVGVALSDVLAKALARDPSQRPRDAEALLRALRKAVPSVRNDVLARWLVAKDDVEHELARTAAAGLANEARAFASRRESFRALAAIDSALAYTPDDPELAALTETIAAMPLRAPVVRRIARLAVPALLVVAAAVFLQTRSPPATIAPTPVASRAPSNHPDFTPIPSARIPNATLVHGGARERDELARVVRRLRRTPNDSSLLVRQADLLVSIGRLRDAHRVLLAALATAPNDLRILRSLGALYDRLDAMDRALPVFVRLTERAPNDANAWVDRSFAEADDSARLAAVDRSLAISPRHARALRRRCSLLAHLERDDAVRSCDVAVAASPGDAFALADRAAARTRVGDLAGARADIDRAISIRADDPSFFLSRSFIDAAVGDPEAARLDRARACELGREDACSVTP